MKKETCLIDLTEMSKIQPLVWKLQIYVFNMVEVELK